MRWPRWKEVLNRSTARLAPVIENLTRRRNTSQTGVNGVMAGIA